MQYRRTLPRARYWFDSLQLWFRFYHWCFKISSFKRWECSKLFIFYDYIFGFFTIMIFFIWSPFRVSDNKHEKRWKLRAKYNQTFNVVNHNKISLIKRLAESVSLLLQNIGYRVFIECFYKLFYVISVKIFSNEICDGLSLVWIVIEHQRILIDIKIVNIKLPSSWIKYIFLCQCLNWIKQFIYMKFTNKLAWLFLILRIWQIYNYSIHAVKKLFATLRSAHLSSQSKWLQSNQGMDDNLEAAISYSTKSFIFILIFSIELCDILQKNNHRRVIHRQAPSDN